MRALCGLLVLLALGLVSGTAVAGLSSSAGSSMVTGTLSVTTVVPTSAPTVTVTLPVTTITSPTVTLPATVPVTTAVTVPVTTAVTTAPLPVTTTAPAPVTTTAPRVTTTVTPVTPPPAPGTTATVSTTPGATTSVSTRTIAAAPGPPTGPTAPGAGDASASEAGIGSGFATAERGGGAFEDRLQGAGPARGLSTPARGLAPARDVRGPSEAPPARIASARFTLTGSGEGRGGISAGALASELPRSPLGLLLLGLAALLVAIAAIPRDAIPDRRLGALVADRRLELVSVAVTILVTAVLTLALA